MHLPIITTSAQAVALSEQNQDYFYLAAFKLQLWLSDLSIAAVAEYADKADPAERPMQTGQAWRAFHPVFGHVRDEKFHLVISCLGRFSECENPLSKTLLCALAPIYLEHELSGDFIGPKAPDLSHDPLQAAILMRRSVQRMCDWLDAVIHLNTHSLWHREPACFHPEPEKRRLAARDISQPYVAQMADSAMVASYLQPSHPADHCQPASIPLPPQKPNRVPERHWSFPQLDQALISLWPLVKLHNWTYADLWNVLKDAGVPLCSSPAQNHRQLAGYCLHQLGLRKSGHGQTVRNSMPPGHDVAGRLLCHSRSSPALGHGPWS